MWRCLTTATQTLSPAMSLSLATRPSSTTPTPTLFTRRQPSSTHSFRRCRVPTGASDDLGAVEAQRSAEARRRKPVPDRVPEGIGVQVESRRRTAFTRRNFPPPCRRSDHSADWTTGGRHKARKKGCCKESDKAAKAHRDLS